MNVQEEIKSMCDAVAQMLIEKNRKYGNSALEPLRIFSKADMLETIRVRMDDKLCRIKNEQSDEDEDVYMDLIGYIVLYMIAKKRQKGKDWFRSVPLGEPEAHLEAAKSGMRPSSITLILDDKGPLTQFKCDGDLSDALRTAKSSSVAGIDKMSAESLDCLLCQAQESGDYTLVRQIQDEQDRRGSGNKQKNQILFKGRPIAMATDKEITDQLDSLLTGEHRYRPDALLQISYLADECTRRGITMKPFERHLDDDVTPTT